jgi:hypothetical protein
VIASARIWAAILVALALAGSPPRASGQDAAQREPRCEDETTPDPDRTPVLVDLAWIGGLGEGEEHSVDIGIGSPIRGLLRISGIPVVKVKEGGARPMFMFGVAIVEHGLKPGLEFYDDRDKIRRTSDSTQVNPEDARQAPSLRPWVRMDWTFRPCLGKRLTDRVGAGLSLFLDAREYRPGVGAFLIGRPVEATTFIFEWRHEVPIELDFDWWRPRVFKERLRFDPVFSLRIRFGNVG